MSKVNNEVLKNMKGEMARNVQDLKLKKGMNGEMQEDMKDEMASNV